MFSHQGSAAFRKDLVNIRILCERLGHPEKKFRSIHVGGTNGKGSVSHMLAAIFQTAGFKTGLYTSPHLYDFRERIKLNGKEVDETFVVRFVERVQPIIAEINPSFFELTVAMAFECFAQEQVDIAIIEVGLGGRLDSTNILQPELSIITNIGWDHMNLLGNTLNAIASEKAGIIKESTPVIVGEQLPETREVFERFADLHHAPIYFADECFHTKNYDLHNDLLHVTLKPADSRQPFDLALDLPGIYQTKNIRTVLTAIDVWNTTHPQEKIEHGALLAALQQTRQLTGLHGRWEVIHHQPRIILEVAHNSDGIRQMLTHLSQLKFRKLHIVIGMVKDKDITNVLSLLPTYAQYYFTQAHLPRALDADSLREEGLARGLKGNAYADVNIAISEAKAAANNDDLIVVCGSIFLVAEVERPQ